MRLSNDKLKNLRMQKNWSQEVLATASGLSLRTIQRIEKTGNASNESCLSLLSALDVPVSALKSESTEVEANWTGDMIMKALAAIIVLKLIIVGMMAMNGDFTDFFNLPSVLFVVFFTLAMTLLAYDLDRLISALKGIRYIFSQDIIGGLGARQLAGTYQSQIQFCYGAGVILFLIGCIAIFGVASGKTAGFDQGAIAGFGVNLLPLLYATMISEGLLRPLKIKLLAADQSDASSAN